MIFQKKMFSLYFCLGFKPKHYPFITEGSLVSQETKSKKTQQKQSKKPQNRLKHICGKTITSLDTGGYQLQSLRAY